MRRHPQRSTASFVLFFLQQSTDSLAKILNGDDVQTHGRFESHVRPVLFTACRHSLLHLFELIACIPPFPNKQHQCIVEAMSVETPLASPERQTDTDLVLEPPLVIPGCDANANANETSTPPNGKAKKKPSKKKTPYDHNKLKEALKWFVNHRSAKPADAVAKFSPSLKASIYRRVNEMNLNQLRNGTDDDKQKALDAIDALEDKLRANKSPVSERKWLTEAEEEVYVAKIEQLGAMGFPVRKDVLAHDMLEYVRERDGGKSYDSLTGKERKYSDAVVARFLVKHKDRLGSYCSSNLGEERGEKATMEIMQQFFDNVFTYCEEMITEGVFPSDWKTVADIPGANKYNMDEMNKSTKQNRSKIIASKKQKKSGRFEGRFFESSDGDHQPFHVSLALTTRGDGAHGRGFTPGPMLIYSSQSKNKTGTYSVKERHLKHVAIDMDGNPIDNKHNFQLSVNENGSMTLDLFLVWAKHFVEVCVHCIVIGRVVRVVCIVRIFHVIIVRFISSHFHVFKSMPHMSLVYLSICLRARARMVCQCCYSSMAIPRGGRSLQWSTSDRTTFTASAFHPTPRSGRSQMMQASIVLSIFSSVNPSRSGRRTIPFRTSRYPISMK